MIIVIYGSQEQGLSSPDIFKYDLLDKRILVSDIRRNFYRETLGRKK